MKSFALVVAALGPAALVGTLGRLSVDAAWVERLGWTLIHTFWQFALIALVAAVLQWSLRHRSARARYAAGAVLLGAMAVAPAVTCCVVDVSRPRELKQTRIAARDTPDETPSPNALSFVPSPLQESAVSEPPSQGSRPSNRRAAEPRATVRAHLTPRERPAFSWVAAVHSTLAPRLRLLVSLWLAGMALFALRPVWGLWMQWRLRWVGLSPVPASVVQSLDDLARRLGLRRTVGIAQSVRVGVPMAVGYLRPLILLPGCVLTGLTAAQLEALLAHELAHIRRHDWLVNAFQLLVETVFFYHPAVWWLSRQIRQERENCCDDLAVSLVGDRGTVGRMLLALEELRERTPGLALAATGGNLLSRVRRVVTRGRQPEPAGREWLPAAILFLVAGLGGAAWAMSAGTVEKKNPPPATPAARTTTGGRSDAKANALPRAKSPDVRRISGRVVDTKGEPVNGARLWWVVLDDFGNDGQFTIEGTADARGRFALEAPATWKPRQGDRFLSDLLWVFAPRKELTVVRPPKGVMPDSKESRLVISLAPATETEYEVSDEQGRPVAGAIVEPRRFKSERLLEVVPRSIRGLLLKRTDQSGRARLSSLPRDYLNQIEIQAAGFGTQRQQVDGLDQSSPHRNFTLRAAGRIEGRLIADERHWVRGARFRIRTEKARPWKTVSVTHPDGTLTRDVVWEAEGAAVVETDEQGRFRIPAIASGPVSITVARLPTESLFAPRLRTDVRVTAGETAHVEIRMEKLVRVKGTIRTDDTQMPVAAAEIFVGYGESPQGERVTSDKQGRYEARVLPGTVSTQVVYTPPEVRAHYVQVGEPWTKQIEVTAAPNGFELPPIVLAETAMRGGTLIDQVGRPIAGARVSGVRRYRQYGFAETNSRGEFSLQLPKTLTMDRYEITMPGAVRIRKRARIVKHEPLTLQFDLSSASEKPTKSTRRWFGEPQETDEHKLAVSAAPAPLSTSPRSTTLAAAAELKASVGRPTITGKVHDSDGNPVAGAMVMIWTAGVKHGYSAYCPSCYADSGKRAVTDAAGSFAIAHVDPELRFRLLVVREGYAPVFVAKVDPFAGPAAVKLSHRPLPDDPHRVVRGHVVGPRGEPLAGAVVEAESVWYRDEHGHDTRTWGAVKGLDPLAVANDQGDFEIASSKRASNITLLLRARGMAPRRFDALDTGTERHTLALNRGASIRGRLVSHGQPVGRAEMGLVFRDRMIDRFYPEVRVGTEPDGSFLFVNVPVPGEWYVYAKMESIHSRGATAAVECVTEREDETVSLGDVMLQPGHRVSGRVVLTDGKPIPDGMRIRLSAKRAWDDQTHELPPDGRFEFVGLPTDDFSISPAVKGYQPSGKNPNLNLGIDGFIDRDSDNLVILLDPGKETFSRMGKDFRGKLLRSAPLP